VDVPLGVVDELDVPGALGRITHGQVMSRRDGMSLLLNRLGIGERVAIRSANAAKIADRATPSSAADACWCQSTHCAGERAKLVNGVAIPGTLLVNIARLQFADGLLKAFHSCRTLPAA
jgi:hypothetical protein